MGCPLCGEVCRCSFVSGPAASRADADFLAASGVDPEVDDDSEEQFAASLIGTTGGRAEFAAEHEPRVPAGEPPALTGIERAAHETGSTPSDFYRGDTWRSEVASRVTRYRARRRRAAEASLSLDFEPPPPSAPPTAAEEARAAAVQRVATRFAATPEPLLSPPELPRSETTNVIEFPRPAAPRAAMVVKEQLQPSLLDELAEPLPEKPRILDAPEAEPSESVVPPLPAIILDEPAPEVPPLPEFELPLVVAPVAERLFSGLVDAAIVIVALALFALVALQLAHAVPELRAAAGVAVLATAVFWFVYHALFLIYAGRTPGMQLAHLTLRDFEGEPLPRVARRGRALAMLVSAAPLGLGFLWACFDEDTLCWHDRITRTCVVEE